MVRFLGFTLVFFRCWPQNYLSFLMGLVCLFCFQGLEIWYIVRLISIGILAFRVSGIHLQFCVVVLQSKFLRHRDSSATFGVFSDGFLIPPPPLVILDSLSTLVPDTYTNISLIMILSHFFEIFDRKTYGIIFQTCNVTWFGLEFMGLFEDFAS